MSYLNNQKNHPKQLLGLALATAMLTTLFAVPSYSGTRSGSFSAAKTNGATIPLTQPQTPPLKANGKIAFTSDRDGNSEIYSVNPDGTGTLRLTFDPGADDYPAWSPDGSKIAYLSLDQSGHYAIKITSASGVGQRTVTPVVFDLSTRNFCGERFSLSWSPDGARIAFRLRQAIARRVPK